MNENELPLWIIAYAGEDPSRNIPKLVKINHALKAGKLLQEFYAEHVFRPCHIDGDWTNLDSRLTPPEKLRLVLHHLSESDIWKEGVLQDLGVSFESLVAFAGLRITGIDQGGFPTLEFVSACPATSHSQPKPAEVRALEKLMSSPQWKLSEKKDLDRLVAWIIDRHLTYRYSKKVRKRKWGSSIDLWARERDFWQTLRRQRYALGPGGIKGELIAEAAHKKRGHPWLSAGKDSLASWLMGAGELYPEGAIEFNRPGPLYLYYAPERYFYTLLALRSVGHGYEIALNIGLEWEGDRCYEEIMDPEKHALLLRALGPSGEQLLSESDIAFWAELLGCTASQVADFNAECDNLMIPRDGKRPPMSTLARRVLISSAMFGSLIAPLLALVTVILFEVPCGIFWVTIATLLGFFIGLDWGKDRGDRIHGWKHLWGIYFGMLGRRKRKRSLLSMMNAGEQDQRPAWRGSFFTTDDRIDKLACFMKLCKMALDEDRSLTEEELDWLYSCYNPFKQTSMIHR